MVRAPLRQEISRLRATTEQKNLSPYPRAAPLEMTERQTAYHHFKPHGYRNTSKNGMRPFAAGDFSTQSHNRIQKHLSPYPRAAPLEMTERQAAYHHFKPHGYRKASKKRLRRNDCHFSQSLFICSYFILASTEGVGARFSETSGSSLKPPDFLSCFSLFFSMKW